MTLFLTQINKGFINNDTDRRIYTGMAFDRFFSLHLKHIPAMSHDLSMYLTAERRRLVQTTLNDHPLLLAIAVRGQTNPASYHPGALHLSGFAQQSALARNAGHHSVRQDSLRPQTARLQMKQ